MSFTDVPYGAYLDEPAILPDPQDLAYGDVGQAYDPDTDWRDAQLEHIEAFYGPDLEDDEPEDEEATDG